MPLVVFTANLRRHIDCPPRQVPADTVRAALDAVFDEHAALRGYVLDDQDCVRTHIVIFVDGVPLRDRTHLSDAVRPDSEIYVLQALSGG